MELPQVSVLLRHISNPTAFGSWGVEYSVEYLVLHHWVVKKMDYCANETIILPEL